MKEDEMTETTDAKVVIPMSAEVQSQRSFDSIAMEVRNMNVWFNDHHVLQNVNLQFPTNSVTALIGPSGCGKSTFIRTLNRMHELLPGAKLAGEAIIDGEDIYAPHVDPVNVRLKVGMVFQKPNPFPSMSIGDNVLAGLRLAKRKESHKQEVMEQALTRAGLWNEVTDRLKLNAGTLSGGQQQRLCIARSLVLNPEVLLMDEPCSALDPGSTRRIEETIKELSERMTIIIVTHNMQQALRVSDFTAFFLSEDGKPGEVVENGETVKLFHEPEDQRTNDYVHGRFG
jgi:phosphate transport system ATP-binding protein